MSTGKKRENLSNVDSAWWRMEDPTNLMMVTGFFALEANLERQALQELLVRKLLAYDRFCQRVRDDKTAGKPYWEECEVDMDYHLVTDSLPDPGGYETLREKVAELMSEPLDYERPVWQIHLLSNFKGGCALVVRTHHCIADGMALISIILSMTGNTPEQSLILTAENEDESDHHISSSGVFKTVGKALINIVNPVKMWDLAKLGGEGALTTARLLLKKADPITLFKGPLGVPKVPAWSEPIPLEQIKAIKNVTGGTVNDVLLTAMTGGLRRYMIERGADVTDLNFRAFVPVNLRPPGKIRQLGNQFGLVFLSLPVGVDDVLERLVKLKKRMDRIKNSPEAVIALGILKAVGMTPTEIQRIVVNIFGAKSTAVMTNVPGPRQPLYLAGQKVSNIMFWVPQSGRVGLGVSILSYAGSVRLGLVTDEGLVPDPGGIIEGFYKELEAMNQLVTQVKEDKA